MCTEDEPRKTIAKRAKVVTATGVELEGVTIMGPVREVQGSLVGYEVRLYGRNIPQTDNSPWVVIQAAQDREKRKILL
jgi:hypothetical protein